jgi:AraC-like DNA-binding protein/mannose-6-phosphate isomerase-like protein (cupin superfamily)
MSRDLANANPMRADSGSCSVLSAKFASELADKVRGRSSAREIVPVDPSSGFRWFEHDYPTAMARWNHHPEFELHFIRHGAGTVVVGDYVGRFAAGHVALIGANLPHDWISDLGPGEVVHGRDVVLQFDGSRMRQGFVLFPEMEELDGLLREAARGIEFVGATAESAAAQMLAIGHAQGLERLQHLFGLFATLTRAPAADRVLLSSPLFASAGEANFERVVRYIIDNIDRDVRMADAAKLVGLSETSFSRTFKRMAGRNFVDFVRKLRVAQACRLLRQTDQPVSTICYEVGFGNLSNFNRQFRVETRTSPTEYRREVHSQN